MAITGYAQLYVTKQDRTTYNFAFRVFDTCGQRIEGVDEPRLIKTKKQAKEVAKVFAAHAQKTRGLSHVTIFVDGVQVI